MRVKVSLLVNTTIHEYRDTYTGPTQGLRPYSTVWQHLFATIVYADKFILVWSQTEAEVPCCGLLSLSPVGVFVFIFQDKLRNSLFRCPLLSWRIFLLRPNPSTRTRPALYSYTLLFSFSVHLVCFFIISFKLMLVWTDVCVKSDATANSSTFTPASHTDYRICRFNVYHCSTLIVSTCRFTEKNLTWGDALSGQ